MSRARARGWVVVASVALVLAVWGSLALSRRLPARGAAPDIDIALPSALDGFQETLGYLPDGDLLGFVEIPAGPFVMGSDPGVDSLAFDVEWWGEGRVQGTFDLPTSFIGRYEVTVAQFAAYARASGRPPADRRALDAPPTHPVAWVSWADAVRYAEWLDGALRGRGAVPAGWDDAAVPDTIRALLGAGWRVALPTEAQWEKAARGIDARIYPWGNEARPDRAHYRASGTVPVGSLPCPECPYPVSDMAGNVWEWTSSPYQRYPFDPADDAATIASEALWVMRGGSFADTEQHVRAANRGGADPGARRPFIGFRVALVFSR